MDVADAAPQSLLAAMELASPRDLVARQYVTGFSLVLNRVAPWLAEGAQCGWNLTDTIIYTAIRVQASFPDSLITRKCGEETSRKANQIAKRVLQAGGPGDSGYLAALADFDFWLRSDGHRRNPGTTADLIAAGLFAGLREGLIRPPYR
jgi:triphosphoribosyl-dephospho-CoA synthase